MQRANVYLTVLLLCLLIALVTLMKGERKEG